MQKYFKGNKRSVKAKKHISLSLIFRIIDIVLSFLLVPLILNYVTNEEYGIWILIFSIVNLFNFLNVGIDGGLRNKFAIALAENRIEDAKHFVSTAYASLTLICSVAFLLFLSVFPFLDLVKIFNVDIEYERTVSILVVLSFASFCLTLIFKIIITILSADQKPSILNLKNLTQKILQSLSVIFLIYTTESSLLLLGVLFSVIPLLVLIIFTIYYFRGEYKQFTPSFSYMKFSYFKDIMDMGLKIFIIRIAVVVLFATDNMIITQLFGPSDVTTYQVAHKYFSLPLMLFVIFTQALWSAVTEAYYKKEYKWIRNAVNKLLKLWIIFSIGVVIMLCLSTYVYEVWLQNKVVVPFSISLGWAVFVILQTFNSIFVNVINGIGKLKINLFTAINALLLNIPLSVFFCLNLKMGISGVIFATSALIALSIILRKIQYEKIMNRTASGLWNE